MAQASSFATTIPSASNAAALYLPEISWKGEIYIPELTLTRMTREAVISDIASGQHEDVIRVTALDRAAGKTWNASEEIAYEVLHSVVFEHGLGWSRFSEQFLRLDKWSLCRG